MSEETKGGHDLKNSSTKITSDKTIKVEVEVTNVTIEKGFKAIEKVVKAPWKRLLLMMRVLTFLTSKKVFKTKEKTWKSDLETPSPKSPKSSSILIWLTALSFLIGMAAIFIYVPTEQMEGVVQRIMYFHIPAAWLAFFSFFIVFICSILFLWKKEREWDIYALASAEIGVIFCSLVLITGPIWARPIWGAWWVWDARLTSTLILWLIYVSYLMLRYQTDVGSMRARFAAVLGIVGFLDIPFIHFSVLWWRTFHPPPKMISPEGLGPGMDPSMVSTLLLSLGAFTLLYFVLMGQRIKVEMMRDEVERLKKDHLYSN
jgi:heme exporter protein C